MRSSIGGSGSVLGRFAFPVFGMALLPSACSSDSDTSAPSDRFTSTDSAGVVIHHSTGPERSAERAWTISPDPEMQFGSVAGEPATQFTYISAATELESGEIALVNGRNIRVFGADGVHRASFGQAGGGPRDFGRSIWIAAGTRDTVVVWDPENLRISRFSSDGELGRQIVLRSELSSYRFFPPINPTIWRFDRDGTIAYTAPQTSARGNGLSRDSIRVITMDAAAPPVFVWDILPGREMVMFERRIGGRVGFPNLIGPNALFTLRDRAPRVAEGGDRGWEIRLRDLDGEIREIIRSGVPTTALDEAQLRIERERVLDLSDGLGASEEELAEIFDDLPKPDVLPAIGALEFDRMGNLWVGRRIPGTDEVRRYDVFSPEGRWITTVEMPEEIDQVLEFGVDYILARWLDDFDVQYLRRYGIEKPPVP